MASGSDCTNRQVEKLEGQSVRFGQTVQLQHEQSGLFLTQLKEKSENKNDALKMILHSGHLLTTSQRTDSMHTCTVDPAQICTN